MPWHAVKIRSDLHRIIQTQAREQSRSVAGQVDWLLTRALEQATGGTGSAEPPAAAATSSPARASNTSPRSGAALANDVVGASRVDPAPLDTVEGQTDIYEMLAGCPECAGRMESVGDGPQRCVDCGFTREES
jgi:hypothetical protein